MEPDLAGHCAVKQLPYWSPKENERAQIVSEYYSALILHTEYSPHTLFILGGSTVQFNYLDTSDVLAAFNFGYHLILAVWIGTDNRGATVLFVLPRSTFRARSTETTPPTQPTSPPWISSQPRRTWITEHSSSRSEKSTQPNKNSQSTS